MKSISESALISRINRKLQHDGEVVRSCRVSSADFHRLGRHYVVDLSTNCVVRYDIDPAELGLRLGVIKHRECCDKEAAS